MMKATIAQVVGTFGLGGAERLAYNLACALVGGGYRSLCVALKKSGAYPRGDARPELFELGTPKIRVHGLVRASGKLRRLIRDAGIDVLHVHGENALLFCAAATHAMRRRPRLWFTWHVPENVLGGSSWRRRALVWALKRCDLVFGASRDIVKKLGVVPELCPRLHVFRNFVPDLGEPSYEPHQQPVPEIVWQARIVPKKDPKALIRSAAVLKAEGLRFHVTMAGSGHGRWTRYVAETRQLISSLGVDDVVSMVGWIDDVSALLRSSAIGVQCSNTEGLSMSLLEQMMAGLVVVATDVGDTSVAVRNSKTGLLIPPAADQDALCAALRRVVQDRQLRMRLGRAARREAVARFGPSAAVEQVTAALSGRIPSVLGPTSES